MIPFLPLFFILIAIQTNSIIKSKNSIVIPLFFSFLNSPFVGLHKSAVLGMIFLVISWLMYLFSKVYIKK